MTEGKSLFALGKKESVQERRDEIYAKEKSKERERKRVKYSLPGNFTAWQ